MGRKEVLKVVGSHLMNRRGVLDRFLGEIRHAAQLHHPNVVTAYSVIRLGESLVLAMEYVEGLDLAKMVKARGPLPVANASNYVHQAALGLQHAHEHAMVHRDIKPSNLMLARQGNRAMVKVLDFGLAKVSREVPVDGTLTFEGQMLGTPDFIAPEQISDARNADIRADIYSLGCTLYYLLSGGPPFQGTSLYDILQAHHSRDALPLNLARPAVPVELAALVGKMMAKEPERRFQTPAEVAKALTPFFKKGNAAPVRWKPDVSQSRQPEVEPTRASLVSVPRRPATEVAPAPAPAARKPSQPTRRGSILEGFIDLRETEPLFDRVFDAPLPVAAPQASRRNLLPWSTAYEKLGRLGPRSWWAAAAVLLLAFVVVWVVVLRVRTSNGMIELVNLPKDAEVLVDGEEVAVTWPGGSNPAVITVTAGKHMIRVKKDGLEISGDEVTVQAEGREKFTVRLVPPAKLPRDLPKADEQGLIKNTIGMTLKLIPAGEFMMGSPAEDNEAFEDEKPQHRVRITRPFYLGIHEVTRGQFRRFVDGAGYQTEAEKDATGGQGWSEETKKFEHNPRYNWQHTGFDQTDEHPVVNVSWNDAQAFITWLSRKEGNTYRLPTEAEWEYACRAGSTTRYSCGDDPEGLAAVGNIPDGTAKEKHPEWTWAIAARDGFVYTAPVGRYNPNAWGLFDMHGNVLEWCSDGYAADYYKHSPVEDPQGVDGASHRVNPGGGWFLRPRYARSAFRHPLDPRCRYCEVGFRVARSPAGEVGASPTTTIGNLGHEPDVKPTSLPTAPKAGSVVSPSKSDNANAWSRLMAKSGRQSSAPAPYACWTFESDARDEIGSMHGRLVGGANVREGRLYLDGKTGHMRTEPLPQGIREKTLEAWVFLHNLDQRGGGVISIEAGATFDAVVFGEREPKKWIAGSEWFHRTVNLRAPTENAKPRDPIHIAVVYDLEGGITVYREGKRYADRYVPRGNQATLQTYPAGQSYVLVGERGTRLVNNFLAGAIEEARLYDRALTADEVAASYGAGVIRVESQQPE
jgi:formylglycine-generating enzyme required for sulfatase activity/serine/threonine protein kinase